MKLAPLAAAMLPLFSGMAASPSLPEVVVPRTPGPASIDGSLEEPFWNKAARITLLKTNSETPASGETQVKLISTKDGLLIGFFVKDTEIIAQDRPKDDNTYYDDCVEAFLASPVDSPVEAFGTEINAAGSVADFLYRPVGWVNRGWSMRDLQTATRQDREGFTMEIFIPWSGLPKTWNLGNPITRLRANFARWDRPGRNFFIWVDPQAAYPDPLHLDRYGWLVISQVENP